MISAALRKLNPVLAGSAAVPAALLAMSQDRKRAGETPALPAAIFSASLRVQSTIGGPLKVSDFNERRNVVGAPRDIFLGCIP